MTLRDKAREICQELLPPLDRMPERDVRLVIAGMRAALERALEDTAPMWGGAHIEALIAELEEP